MAETQTAYVGRTHRPCGACGVLVWIPEGCPHFRVGRVALTRRQINDAEKARVRAECAAFHDVFYF